MLTAFTENDDSHAAFNTLRETLSAGDLLTRNLGGQGFSEKRDVTWHPKVGIWSLLEVREDLNRFWCCYGIENPTSTKALNIALEINPPYSGTNLRMAGAFAWGPGGLIHLCHTGRIGGGRRGVGKGALVENYWGEWTQMQYERRIVDVVDLGPIDSSHLASHLAWYTREVVRIKDRILRGPDQDSPQSGHQGIGPPTFVPEFSGARSPFTVRGTIEARVDHGPVVAALANVVSALGHEVHNDHERDLFTMDARGQLSCLFEVKTDVSTTSIYTAVGQLLLNGASRRNAVRLVLVLPGAPKRATREALSSIGIRVLPYMWKRRKPVIEQSHVKRVMR